jgi:threonine aldolase
MGRVVHLKDMDSVKALAKEKNIPVHLDGARIFNAALALGVDAKEIAERADSVMFCLSKGLCSPVGSLLAGTKKFVEEARYKRKIMGGAMRQAGILAAAGIISLTEHIKFLKEDHRRAKDLAQGLAEIDGIVINKDEVEINMVFFCWPPAKDEKIAKRAMEVLAKHEVITNPPENGVFRYVTHYWIKEAEISAILEASKEAFGKGN